MVFSWLSKAFDSESKMLSSTNFSDYDILYNKIVSACNFIEEDSGNKHFSIAAYVVFDSLDRKKDDEN